MMGVEPWHSEFLEVDAEVMKLAPALFPFQPDPVPRRDFRHGGASSLLHFCYENNATSPMPGFDAIKATALEYKCRNLIDRQVAVVMMNCDRCLGIYLI